MPLSHKLLIYTIMLRFLRRLHKPPTHFSGGTPIPHTFQSIPTTSLLHSESPEPFHSESQSNQYQNTHSPNSHSPAKELSSLIAMLALGYLAIDNYLNRVKLEKLNAETTAINLKTLQIQQANFQQARRKKDLQVLQDRKDNQKLMYKLAMHIAMLRKQLLDSGIDPVTVEESIRKFELSIKIDNSIKNLTGQSFWVEDEIKGYMPDVKEYDSR